MSRLVRFLPGMDLRATNAQVSFRALGMECEGTGEGVQGPDRLPTSGNQVGDLQAVAAGIERAVHERTSPSSELSMGAGQICRKQKSVCRCFNDRRIHRRLPLLSDWLVNLDNVAVGILQKDLVPVGHGPDPVICVWNLQFVEALFEALNVICPEAKMPVM